MGFAPALPFCTSAGPSAATTFFVLTVGATEGSGCGCSCGCSPKSLHDLASFRITMVACAFAASTRSSTSAYSGDEDQGRGREWRCRIPDVAMKGAFSFGRCLEEDWRSSRRSSELIPGGEPVGDSGATASVRHIAAHIILPVTTAVHMHFFSASVMLCLRMLAGLTATITVICIRLF